MGRKSVKTNKNIYQESREKTELTRLAASERMEFISAGRIEKIESGKSLPHPDEVITMADCYDNPTLCNYYCTHECPIGIKNIPEIEEKPISQITLEILSELSNINANKERLIEIVVDGKLSHDEVPDFLEIKENLEKMSMTIDSLKLWVNEQLK